MEILGRKADSAINVFVLQAFRRPTIGSTKRLYFFLLNDNTCGLRMHTRNGERSTPGVQGAGLRGPKFLFHEGRTGQFQMDHRTSPPLNSTENNPKMSLKYLESHQNL